MAKSKTKISLMDLKRTDELEEASIKTEVLEKVEVLAISPVSSVIGDYEKLSVSIPVDTFETLQNISRERRRAKMKHTMSQMVREALDLWLQQRNQTKSI